MLYVSKRDKKVIVELIEDKGGFVKFNLNGIVIQVASNRFYKLYEKTPD
jgi:hypothetical protein